MQGEAVRGYFRIRGASPALNTSPLCHYHHHHHYPGAHQQANERPFSSVAIFTASIQYEPFHTTVRCCHFLTCVLSRAKFALAALSSGVKAGRWTFAQGRVGGRQAAALQRDIGRNFMGKLSLQRTKILTLYLQRRKPRYDDPLHVSSFRGGVRSGAICAAQARLLRRLTSRVAQGGGKRKLLVAGYGGRASPSGSLGIGS
ncbi:hypothetical protein E2C01_014356 [Portunus trituberculatus]|uniref:Uncharacterized protein n=1 Tax=Portunus trituberculatus TaxID=210409 RepID=A0A5B7DIK7_PORTR|nr:hypothetical protein [Portunus trituberculatus]